MMEVKMDFEYHDDKEEQSELREPTAEDERHVSRRLIIIAAVCVAVLLLIYLTGGMPEPFDPVFVPAG
jgi:hypothetical protein